MPKVIVIVGPTAVGKTKLSIALAKKCQAEIISGDSMQIYRGMDIGTAKVTPVEMEGVAHHLIDCRHFSENYSVMDFQREVRKEIAKIIHDNNWTLEEYVLHYGLGSDCLITK